MKPAGWPDDGPTPEEVARMLRVTEARLGQAKALLSSRRMDLAGMTNPRTGRARRRWQAAERGRLVAHIASVEDAVEVLQATIDAAREYLEAHGVVLPRE